MLIEGLLPIASFKRKGLYPDLGQKRTDDFQPKWHLIADIEFGKPFAFLVSAYAYTNQPTIIGFLTGVNYDSMQRIKLIATDNTNAPYEPQMKYKIVGKSFRIWSFCTEIRLLPLISNTLKNTDIIYDSPDPDVITLNPIIIE